MKATLFRLLALLLLVPAAFAHEIGDSQILVEPGDTTWTARIVTAPTALINRLEEQAGQPPSRDLTQEQAAGRLSTLAASLPAHLHVTLDGAEVPTTLAVEQLHMPADQSQPSFLVLRAEGPLPAGATSLTWRFDLLSGQHALLLAGRTHWVEGGTETAPLPLRPGPPPTLMQVVGQYVHLGFIHIVPDGPDHVLFVLGLVLLTTRLRPLLVQVTSFTLAHCLTLFLALYGVVELPARIVEPLIALSIAYVAIENIFARRVMRTSGAGVAMRRLGLRGMGRAAAVAAEPGSDELNSSEPGMPPWRPALVFCFGLLHGLGFAGVLSDLGLPDRDRVAALIAFNVGIEFGQLAVIALAYGLVLHWFKHRPWFHARLITPTSAAIALVGLYWTVERVVG
ncbi:HupE/UreJ family protein [Niveispirillum sp. KHB5.9]|uniref:HupE/UreJ family protein n=1 Tax=Niveispirillum sp. KHB5.9 TaxID=3400269 RepID=UPI003A8564CE